jgi:hypothetical protein
MNSGHSAYEEDSLAAVSARSAPTLWGIIHSDMFELRKLQHRRDKILASHKKKTRELVSRNASAEERQALTRKTSADFGTVLQDIEIFLTDQLCDELFKFDLAIPSQRDEEIWEHDDANRYWLTPLGRNSLRKLIDAEKARRFEVKTLWVTKFWLPLFAALVGIIGAITGFVAVLRHTK